VKEIDLQFRARAHAWADRPPRRSAAAAARRARTASRVPSRSPARRLALAAVAVGLVALGVALLAPSGGGDDLAAARPATVAAPAPEPRLIVIELASGTRLYVALTPDAVKRRST
jgi:hypothetical protein